MKWQNVMIDLETMGKGPTAAIVSIGAVAFDVKEGLGPEFYQAVDLENSIATGGVMDASTVTWWLQQEHAARSGFGEGDHLDTTLQGFSNWLDNLDEIDRDEWPTEIRIWGNGAAFDNVILNSAYRACGIYPPWSYKNNRCYLTLRALFPDVEFTPAGTKHNALDDAKAQAEHAVRLLRLLSELV